LRQQSNSNPEFAVHCHHWLIQYSIMYTLHFYYAKWQHNTQHCFIKPMHIW